MPYSAGAGTSQTAVRAGGGGGGANGSIGYARIGAYKVYLQEI